MPDIKIVPFFGIPPFCFWIIKQQVFFFHLNTDINRLPCPDINFFETLKLFYGMVAAYRSGVNLNNRFPSGAARVFNLKPDKNVSGIFNAYIAVFKAGI